MNPMPIVLGTALAVFGVVLIIWRESISDLMRARQRSYFGRLGERVARESAARSYLIIGPFGILTGLAIVALGLFHHG